MHQMEARGTLPAGVIYGNASSTQFDFAVTDGRLRRLDYVAARTPDGILVLGQVLGVKRESKMGYEEAVDASHGDFQPAEKLTAHVQVIGFRDDRGILQVPRLPFSPGSGVTWAGEELIRRVLGLDATEKTGAYLGTLKGTRIPVHLHINTIVQKHISVLAKTGAGKSYCVGVLMEELLKRGVALVVIDPHDEYNSLVHPNLDSGEVERLLTFGLKPKGFQNQVSTWTTELNPRAETHILRLEGTGLQPNEIVELAGGRLTGAQQGILFQAIKDARVRNPLYSLTDVMQAAEENKSTSKWNVVSVLEGLEATGLFKENGIQMADLVVPGTASIISLKGVAPDAQEVIVARLASLLFEARKSQEVPPFLFVVEEAHNYCPERGLGSALSGPILRTIASEGRKFGMGLAVVTQRPAKVEKNVLSQCNTQVILKVTNPNDLKAIIGSVEGLTSDAADEIARLPVGVALVSGGNLGMPILVDIRTRQTQHGGASVDVMDHTAKPVVRLKPGPTYATAEEIARAKAEREERRERLAKERARAIAEGRAEAVEADAPETRSIEWGEHTANDEETTSNDEALQGPPLEPIHGAPELLEEGPPEDTLPEVEAAAPGPMTGVSWENEQRHDEAVLAREAVPILEPRDQRVHRVANRVGYVATGRPEETLELLRRAAARANVPATRYLDVFAKVGRQHCHREAPDCAPCPLAAKCAYKRKVDAEPGQKRGIGKWFRRGDSRA